MNIGFTGTRRGMTTHQKEGFVSVLNSLLGKDNSQPIFHHGGCVGADEDATRLVRENFSGVRIIGYPCNIRGMQSGYAIETCDELKPERPPLDRNEDIVVASRVMLACPKEMTEQRRGGTWHTIRLARRYGRLLHIIYPLAKGTTMRVPKPASSDRLTSNIPSLSTKERLGLTPFQVHKERWKDGCGSELCSRARRIVLARGKIPCNVLYIGEAPGKTENLLGSPFVGPAGTLLDEIIERGMNGTGFSYALTNLVGCIPFNEEGKKTEEPPDDAVTSCQPRLDEMIRLCDGSDLTEAEYNSTLKMIVAVGTCASAWLDSKMKGSLKLHRSIPVLDIMHPAYILRQNIAQRGLLVQRCVACIATNLADLEETR